MIKDWHLLNKESTPKGRIIYTKMTTQDDWIGIVKVGNFWLAIPNHKRGKQFKTKSQAIKWAKQYMSKH